MSPTSIQKHARRLSSARLGVRDDLVDRLREEETERAEGKSGRDRTELIPVTPRTTEIRRGTPAAAADPGVFIPAVGGVNHRGAAFAQLPGFESPTPGTDTGHSGKGYLARAADHLRRRCFPRPAQDASDGAVGGAFSPLDLRQEYQAAPGAAPNGACH